MTDYERIAIDVHRLGIGHGAPHPKNREYICRDIQITHSADMSYWKILCRYIITDLDNSNPVPEGWEASGAYEYADTKGVAAVIYRRLFAEKSSDSFVWIEGGEPCAENGYVELMPAMPIPRLSHESETDYDRRCVPFTKVGNEHHNTMLIDWMIRNVCVPENIGFERAAEMIAARKSEPEYKKSGPMAYIWMSKESPYCNPNDTEDAVNRRKRWDADRELHYDAHSRKAGKSLVAQLSKMNDRVK